MITEFGKVVRKLRIDKDVALGEMAKSITVSSAYLSAVENGKKAISGTLLRNVSEYFSLNKTQFQKLKEAAKNSPVTVKIDLKKSSSDDRMLVSKFARQVADLSTEQKGNIFEILDEEQIGGDK